ncbi:threonine synthase [Sphingomonas piscis]|uniref:Threonine synthase n=1 Tax=Sphingomonas piscis TaxID=2714943 RepID=A0A6G7YNJ5_9SPHN|nr:threonine synthase [Sphingomonas piscis]QIK78312.1 threonine synthase [Sphingomonas piscis]
MKFQSTRGEHQGIELADAIRLGAAPDGGLFLPEGIPFVGEIDGADDTPAFAEAMLQPFFAGSSLEGELASACRRAFAQPLPIAPVDNARPTLRSLELFHGPTGAFKDFGAQFLFSLLDTIGQRSAPLTVLAATSGDTGAAVGCAAEGRLGASAVILFPEGRVSAYQAKQISCWTAPVQALEVEGDFDDCQRLVKAAFQDRALSERHNLTSANSINIGRLMPQMAYIAAAATRTYRETGEKPGFIIPTGNLGHGFAALYARAMGLPIGPVILVTNANPALSEWHKSGTYTPRTSLATIANAMDVGAPSNFERLQSLSDQLGTFGVELVDDDAIKARIVADYRTSGYLWCPHSATAAEAFARLPEAEQKARPWLACATAHPYKFADVVEPLVGVSVTPTPALAAIDHRSSRAVPMRASLDELARFLGTNDIQEDAA